jgi:hypothetical protein
VFSLLKAIKSMIQQTRLIMGTTPIRHPIPHVKSPPIIEVPDHPRSMSILTIPEMRKNVFDICNSDGIG